MDAVPGSSVHARIISYENLKAWRSCLISTFQNFEESEKQKQATSEMDVSMEKFQDEWIASASKFIATQP